jgi:transposase
MGRHLFWLSDEQWLRMEPHLPKDVRGIERADDRRVISGPSRMDSCNRIE